MARRQYSEDEKSTALAFLQANSGNVRLTARKLKMPTMTLFRWSKGDNIHPVCIEKCTEKKRDLADLFEEEAYAAIQAAGEIRDTASYNFLVTGAAISVDKMRLLREQPTAITQEQPQTEEEKEQRLEELAAQHGIRLVKVA